MTGKRFDAPSAAVTFAGALIGFGVPMLFAPNLTDEAPFLRALFVGLCFFAPAALGFAALRALGAIRRSPKIRFPAFSAVIAGALALTFVLGFAGQYLYMLRLNAGGAGAGPGKRTKKETETEIVTEIETELVTETAGSDIILLIETSSSMDGLVQFFKGRQPVNDAAASFANMLTEASRLGVTEFYNEIETGAVLPLTAMDGAGKAAAQKALAALKAPNGIDGRIDAALTSACIALSGSDAQSRIVIVIADEAPFAQFFPDEDLKNAVRAAGVKVYLFGPEDFASLKYVTDEAREFAEETGGQTFFPIPRISQRDTLGEDVIRERFEEAFRQIADAAEETNERAVEHEKERVVTHEKEKEPENEPADGNGGGLTLEDGLLVYDDNGPEVWTVAVRVVFAALLALCAQAVYFGRLEGTALTIDAAVSLIASVSLTFAHNMPTVLLPAAATALSVFTCILFLTSEPSVRTPFFGAAPPNGGSYRI